MADNEQTLKELFEKYNEHYAELRTLYQDMTENYTPEKGTKFVEHAEKLGPLQSSIISKARSEGYTEERIEAIQEKFRHDSQPNIQADPNAPLKPFPELPPTDAQASLDTMEVVTSVFTTDITSHGDVQGIAAHMPTDIVARSTTLTAALQNQPTPAPDADPALRTSSRPEIAGHLAR